MLLHEWKLEEAQQVWFEEGMEKGIKAKAIAIARNMLLDGLDGEPVEKITRYTGLTADEVEDLGKQLFQ